MLEHLNNVNDVPVFSLLSDEFSSYGRVIDGYDFSEIIDFMKNETAIPQTEGNVYVPSVKEMENTEICRKLKSNFYGGADIQIGYCNGRNRTYNGFEYHKCSEINIAVTDFMLVLAHRWDIENNTYTLGKEKVFFVPKGTAIEMYQTTLHLSPVRVNDEGFKAVVVLTKGTNTPLENEKEIITEEDVLLLQKNKWILCHKDREPLVKMGAHIGLIGENKMLMY